MAKLLCYNCGSNQQGRRYHFCKRKIISVFYFFTTEVFVQDWISIDFYSISGWVEFTMPAVFVEGQCAWRSLLDVASLLCFIAGLRALWHSLDLLSWVTDP